MKPETKAAQKARLIAARKAEKEAHEMRERLLTTSNPIYTAILPLLEAAKADAKERAQKTIAHVNHLLAANGWDANAVAPYPNGHCSRQEYVQQSEKYRLFREVNTYAGSGSRSVNAPDLRKPCPEAEARYIKNAEENAAVQFEKYAYKLTRKIGNTKNAVLKAGQFRATNSPWEYSILTVETDAGTQRWETKTIINHSVHGLAFYQWPTRLMK